MKKLMTVLNGFHCFFSKGSQNILFGIKKGKTCRPVLTMTDLLNACFKVKADSFFIIPKSVAEYLESHFGSYPNWRAFNGNSWFIVFNDDSSYLMKIGNTDFARQAIKINIESLNHFNETAASNKISLPKILDLKEIDQWMILKESKIDIHDDFKDEELLLKNLADFHSSQFGQLNDELIDRMIDLDKNVKMPGFIFTKINNILSNAKMQLTGKDVSHGQIHGDFWEGNVYRTSKNEMGLIDFDRSIDHAFPEFDLINYYFCRELYKAGNTGHNWEALLTGMAADPQTFEELKGFIKKYPGAINESILYTIIQLFILRIFIINFKLLWYSPNGIKFLTRVNSILNKMIETDEPQINRGKGKKMVG